MSQKITTSSRALVESAEREIESLSADEAIALQGHDDVILVDLRDIARASARGARARRLPLPRGMLEFWVDPESKYHKPVFAQDKRFVSLLRRRAALRACNTMCAAHGLARSRTYGVALQRGRRPAGRSRCRRRSGPLVSHGPQADHWQQELLLWSFRPWFGDESREIPFEEEVIPLDAGSYCDSGLRRLSGSGKACRCSSMTICTWGNCLPFLEYLADKIPVQDYGHLSPPRAPELALLLPKYMPVLARCDGICP